MAMKARYTVADGEVVSEVRGGVRKDYVPDPLGSTVALLDNAQSVTDSWEYWPYGELRSGSSATPFQYVGTLGYYKDTSRRTYVRARHYRQSQARWQTIDPLWPRAGYTGYDVGNPLNDIDPSGLEPRGKCELSFFCIPLGLGAKSCMLCLTKQVRNKVIIIKCWPAGSGGHGDPIPKGCWCFNQSNWVNRLQLGRPSRAWGEGNCIMPLVPCPKDEARMRRENPTRKFHPGSMCLHGGGEINNMESGGCITTESKMIMELKTLLKKHCLNTSGKCGITIHVS
ncbi:MAG: hypothetical protein JST30_11440 [Armatimonadetes bacterium]|nr:hypothetical protein [Armatimonadota bacterium]